MLKKAIVVTIIFVAWLALGCSGGWGAVHSKHTGRVSQATGSSPHTCLSSLGCLHQCWDGELVGLGLQLGREGLSVCS